MWLIFAIAAPLMFAVVHVIDSYCVHNIFDKPLWGVITSAFASIFLFLLIPFVTPFVQLELPNIYVVLLSVCVGLIIQLNQALYFKALSYTEAGIIAAYWNLVGAFTPLAAFAIFGTLLSSDKYIGIAVLVASSFALCIADTRTLGKTSAFALIFAGCLFQTTAFLLMDYIFSHVEYFVGFFLINTGIMLGGLMPLILKRVRLGFFKMISHRSYFRLFLLIELLSILAYACVQMAIKLGGASLVAAIDTTAPAFAFIFSLICLQFGMLQDAHIKRRLGIKFVAVGTMSIGMMFIVSS